MDGELEKLYHTLQKLIGLHRQMLELVRQERQAIENADLHELRQAVLGKEMVVHSVRQLELERVRSVAAIAVALKISIEGFSLSNFIIQIQSKAPSVSEKFRSAQNALTILIERISVQNQENKGLVERSLEHVNDMKKNILGEAVPRASTYNPKGQKAGGSSPSPRLISKEA